MRFQKDIEAYAAWQVGNRQLNRELLEFQRMKAYYGENAPYKTLAGFRRTRRSDNISPALKAWRYRNADKNQYERWKAIIGKENMPKTVDEFQQMKYNRKEEFALLKGYKEAQQKQEIHALVSFKTYKAVSCEIDKALVGKSFDGITIKGKKTHFIDRVIGEYQESDYEQKGKRKGVKLKDIVACLQGTIKHSRINEDGSISLTYEGENCQVTVNPDTGMLIQTNPTTRRKKK